MLLLKAADRQINVQEKLSENRDGASFVSVENTQQEAYQGKPFKIGHRI